MWLTWNAAAVVAACLAVVGRPGPSQPTLRSAVRLVAWEAAVILALYALWQWGAEAAITSSQGAIGHARWIAQAERYVPLPTELWVQQQFVPHPLMVQVLNIFYAVVHVPALVVFLIWLFVRHPRQYARWRNVGALLTGACLLIQMVPVAPPRLLPDLGFIDTAVAYHQSVYGPGGIRIAPQLAAMPSVHVAWAILIAVVVLREASGRWRWLVLAHPLFTVVAVVGTANHWWLDGIVAGALLGAAIVVESGSRALTNRLRLRAATSDATDVVVAPEAVVQRRTLYRYMDHNGAETLAD
jgi:hypothetical protein